MSFTVTERPATGAGGRAPKLTGDELQAAIKALKSGKAIVETIAKSRKSVQQRSFDVRTQLRAALGGLAAEDITSRTAPTEGHEKSDDEYTLTVWLTDSGMEKVKAHGNPASKSGQQANS